jgi:hypothetical protein
MWPLIIHTLSAIAALFRCCRPGATPETTPDHTGHHHNQITNSPGAIIYGHCPAPPDQSPRFPPRHESRLSL